MLRPIPAGSFDADLLESWRLSRRPKARKRGTIVFAVPDRLPLETDLKDIRHLPSRAREELEQFFLATNAREDKKLAVRLTR